MSGYGRVKGRWKLWHLSSLVVLAALLLAVENRAPGIFAGLAVLGLFLVPPLAMAWTWDRIVQRIEREDRPPKRLVERARSMMAWFACFLMAWSMIGAFVVHYLDDFD